jgi:hypothetical protein
MTKQEAPASVPIGVYTGEFLGIRDFEGESLRGKDGRPMGPSCVNKTLTPHQSSKPSAF